MKDCLEDKRWQYLSAEEIEMLEDVKVRSEYRRKIGKTVKFIINPLYMYALKHGYDDTDFLKRATVHGMVEELKSFYDSKEIDRDGKMKILLESRKK